MGEWFKRFARKSAEVAGAPWFFALSVVGTLLWLFSGPALKWSANWNFIANTTTTITTWLLVILVQHTQNRDARAVELKLDAIIQALEKTDNRLIGLEYQPDPEIDRVAEQMRQAREDPANYPPFDPDRRWPIP
jgi:low affinity Fe/Cu permease